MNSSPPPSAITSLQNPVIKLMRSLHDKKARRESGLFMAEGEEMMARAQEHGFAPVHYLTTRPKPDWGGVTALLVSEKVMAAVSAQNNPHDVAASFKQRFAPVAEAVGLWLVVENLRDPGNLGSMMRSAEAAGAQGIILVGLTCDPFSPEVVRASTGSIFSLPLVLMTRDDFIKFCKNWPADIVGTHLGARDDYRKNYSHPVLLLMGAEHEGLSPELMAICTCRVRIPMANSVQSLNVSAAAVLMLYEINREILR